MTPDVVAAHPRELPSKPLLVGLAVGAVLLYALAEALAGGFDDAVVRLPVLYGLGVVAAWLITYLLATRAWVRQDERLAWVAWAYGVMGFTVLCLATAAPGFLATDSAMSGAAAPSTSAALRLLGQAAVAVFVLAGIVLPRQGTLLRRTGGAAMVVASALLLWGPGFPPRLVTADGRYTALYLLLDGAAAVMVLVAAVAWIRSIARRPGWTESWVAVSLLCFLANLVFTGAAGGILSAGWWSGQLLLLGGLVMPVLGLLADLPRQMHDLHRHAVGLQERLDREVEMSAQLHMDAAAAAETVAHVHALLDSGAFRAVFQPIFTLDTLAPVGVEALTRFNGTPAVPPDVWFARAKQAGLGLELEMAAARTALGHLRRVPDDQFVSINLSPETIQQRLLTEILAVVPPERLVVEVTEHDAIDNYEELNDVLRDLRARGVRLAVDDAGAGFSSLRHIVRTHPDIIKLDVSLVRDLHVDPVRRALTASLVTFAAQIDARIIAEGIETDEELEAVRELGVTLGQGYHLARPAPIDELDAFEAHR